MSMDEFMRSLSDQQKAMFLAALQDSGTPPEEDVIEPQTKQPSKKTKDPNDFTMKPKNGVPQQKKRKVPVKARENTWTDTGEHRDVSTPEFTKTPRNRKPPQKKTVTCSACGSKSKINANLVQGQYYRCENCVG